MNLPKLPPLDDLDLDVSEIDNSGNQKDIKTNSQADFNVSLELPGLPSLEEFEDLNDENLSTLEDDLENEEHENNFSEDFIKADSEENMEDIFEEELNFEEDFLPVVNQEILPTTMNSVINKDKIGANKRPSNIKNKENNNKDFKEIDEEVIKELFDNIKSKMMSFKNKLFKSDKSKSNENKKISRSKKDNKFVNKMLSVLKIAGIMIVIFGIIFATISFVLKTPSSPITDISHEVKGEEVVVLINKIERSGEGIELTFKNQGDISTSFFIDMEFNSKASLFKKEKFICQSDIIFLEPNKEIRESMRCEDFIEADEYSIEVNFKEIR